MKSLLALVMSLVFSLQYMCLSEEAPGPDPRTDPVPVPAPAPVPDPDTESEGGPEVTLPPIEDEDENPVEELLNIADLMRQLDLKLEDERHDATVALDGHTIEERLQKLITACEKGEAKSQSNRDKQDEIAGRKPADDSKLDDKRHIVQSGNDCPGLGEWINLPPELRSSIIQTYNPDIPEKWRLRIQAYLLSINSEDTDRNKGVLGDDRIGKLPPSTK